MTATYLEKGVLDALYLSFNIQFKDGMQSATEDYKTLAIVLNSNTAIESYPIIDQYGGMREWLGPRKIKEVNAKTIVVKNRNFENSIRVNRDQIADEQTGLYGSLVANLGTGASNLWDDLLWDTMVSNDSYADGKPFYGSTRQYDEAKNGVKIVNLTDAQLTPESFAAARTTMQGYTGHEGTPLNVKPSILVVGPSNENMGQRIVEAEYTRDPDGVLDYNPNRGKVKLMVSTRLVGAHANKWFLLATEESIKPVVIQQRELPRLTRIDAEEAEHVFKNNENLYGTKARGAAFKTAPHLIYMGAPN